MSNEYRALIERKPGAAGIRAPGNTTRTSINQRLKNKPIEQIKQAANALWGVPLASHVKILSFRPFRNAAGTTLGYLDIETSSGLRIYGAKLMTGPKGQRWIAMPATLRRDRDGIPVLNQAGKQVFDPIVEFRDSTSRDRFRDQVIAALKGMHPQLFADGGAP